MFPAQTCGEKQVMICNRSYVISYCCGTSKAEEPSHCGTVGVKHDAIVCTPDTMLARLAIHEAAVICLRFLERGNSMMTTVWTSSSRSMFILL